MKLLTFVALLLKVSVAWAATITVDTTADNTTGGDGRCTLREAVVNVNAAAEMSGGDCAAGSGGDVIKFVIAMPARIRLTRGPLVIQRDLSIVNRAPGLLHVDGDHRTRVFEIAAGTTSMTNVAIEHGNAVNDGGGIKVDAGASLMLAQCLIAGNRVYKSDTNDFDDMHGGGISNAGTLHLADCEVTRNTVDSSLFPASALGGGIHNERGTASLVNCKVTRNTVFSEGFNQGGGISNSGGVLTVTGCTLSANRLNGPPGFRGVALGGAIFNNAPGTVALTDSTLSRNRALGGSDSSCEGGAVYNEGTMTIARCTINRNLSILEDLGESFGGGIANEGTMTITASTLERNGALVRGNLGGTSLGGGIFNGNYSGGDDAASLTMDRCTLVRNWTGMPSYGESFGGGVYAAGGVTVTNSTFVGNRCSSCTTFDGCYAAGGAIYVEGGMEASLTNCTVSGNSTQLRGSLYDDIDGGSIYGDSQVMLTNTIVAGTRSGVNCATPDYDDGTRYLVASGGHNLSSDGTCFAAGSSDVRHANPQLGGLGDYGGPTRTLPLCTGPGSFPTCRGASPAIDAGDDSVTGPPANLTTDQRGLPRLSGAHIDIGAYEVQ